MVRLPLTPEDHERGQRLGQALREARGARSMTMVAAAAGVPVETMRKIESGRVPTPAFFTITALSTELGLSLDDLALACATPSRSTSSRTAATGNRREQGCCRERQRETPSHVYDVR
jgi:transcriptional regulator with XRE-family HTH domain